MPSEKPKDLFFHFKEALLGHRFDGIAGAVQKMVDMLVLNPNTRNTMGTNGRDTIKKNYSDRYVIKSYQDIIFNN